MDRVLVNPGSAIVVFTFFPIKTTAGKADSGDFDQFVADVVTAAHKNGLSDQIIGQVGVVIYSVESQVVQK
ncbi:MAG TPA: hypothetical protein VHC96_07425 [Puia sp.]|nr:hypothetical protein [Puia sp.]